jgi:hypothetical protein
MANAVEATPTTMAARAMEAMSLREYMGLALFTMASRSALATRAATTDET